jgi:two-component system NtrC family sensor kinase
MRALARGDKMHRPTDVIHVLKAAIAALASEIRPRARLVTKLNPLPSVNADEARLGQVFISLLLNASEAMTDGSPSENEITVTTAFDGQRMVTVEVRDTGVGIAPELHQRIFEPFFSVNPVGKGKGLGLAICHHIITELGGTITVESVPNQGTTFKVTLPTSVEPAKTSGAE